MLALEAILGDDFTARSVPVAGLGGDALPVDVLQVRLPPDSLSLEASAFQPFQLALAVQHVHAFGALLRESDDVVAGVLFTARIRDLIGHVFERGAIGRALFFRHGDLVAIGLVAGLFRGNSGHLTCPGWLEMAGKRSAWP